MNLQIKKILVPIDFSEYSKASLKYSSDFAKLFNAKLFLVHVLEPVIYPPDFSMGQISIPTINTEIGDRAKQELDNLCANCIEPGIEFEAIIRNGKPFYEIIESAEELDVDLIIIATHGHSGVEHILFGSTAEKVVRKAPCPVLTTRSPIKGFKYKEAFGKKE